MYFIEAIKNFHSYLFLGRCRRHGRELSVVQVDDNYASTMPVCVECHPQYADSPQTANLDLSRTVTHDLAQTVRLDLSEVEVG